MSRPGRVFTLCSREREKRGIGVSRKLANDGLAITDQLYDIGCRAITETHEDDLRTGERGRAASRRAIRTGSRRSTAALTASGHRQDQASTFALRRERQAGPDVLVRELREVVQDLALGHSAREIPQDITHGQAGPTHGRLAEADGRIDDDSIEK